MAEVRKPKGIKVHIGNRNQKNLKSKKIHNPYGDVYRRRKSFFNFRDKPKSEPSPEQVRRQVSEPVASPPKHESARRQISEPTRSTPQYNKDDDVNSNDNNNNPWRLRSENDEAKALPKEPAGKGRMRFTVKRYDSVPTTDQPGGGGDSADGGLGEFQAPPPYPEPSSSSDNNTNPPSSPEPLTPPSPRASPVTGQPRIQEKQAYSDLDFLDNPSMDSFTSTLFDRGGERDAVALRGRLFAKSRDQRRLVLKEGNCNISLGNVRRRRRRFLHDIFTTLLELRWRYHLIMFSCVFLLTWILFAVIWYIILVLHKDHEHDPDDPNWEPCMPAVYDFVTALLFSIETQHTIGYGSRSMGTKCPEAVVLLMVQSCTGVFFQSLMTGIIFAKLSRPKSRASTIRFSKNAVVCQRDGRFCLLFRVADMRKSHIVSGVVRAVMVKNVITKEGEPLPLAQSLLKTEAENGGEDNSVYLLWPTTVIHWIDEDSPFWKMSAEEMLTERFEIVVFLEGTIESTGMTTQVRTSYLPTEILWGHRLAPLVTYQKENGQYRVDYTLFHSSIPVATPECSPKAAAEGEGGDATGNPKNNFSTYVNRLTHLRPGHRPSASSLVVPSSLTMGAGPADKTDRRARMWRRQSLPKFNTKNGKKRKTSTDIGRSNSLRVRSKTAVNGLPTLLPSPKEPTLHHDESQEDIKTDMNESCTSLDNISAPTTDIEERRTCPDIIEAESVA